ncbi:hypothetical protein PIB30_097909 [Stylosanthes scabra]|uniref:Uncharacterized protein n=1 Tax=Stylosanthes scabra TaxID=79078 RepID=A0ABU6RXR7_9FABA|nr:hypothetical protein [Stylosanthes scabra]
MEENDKLMNLVLAELRQLRVKVDDIDKKNDMQINAIARVESILHANGDSSSGIKGGRRKKRRMKSSCPNVVSDDDTERVQQQLKSVSSTKVNEVEKVFKLTEEETDLITLLTDVDDVPEEVVEVDVVEMLPPKCVNSVVTSRSHATLTMFQPRHWDGPTNGESCNGHQF